MDERKVYGDTEGPLPKITVRQPDVQVVEDPAQITLHGGISYLNHPEYQGMVDKPTLDENQVPNAEKGLMESIPTLFDPGGLVTGATNSYLVNRGLKTPTEAVLEQSIATGLAGIPIVGALAKKNPVVRNTIKQIPFSDQTVLGNIKNRLFNKPRFVEETVNGVPYNKTPNIKVQKGEGTYNNIIKENLPKMEGGYVVDVSSNSIKQVGKNGELKDTGIKGTKFINNFRENELREKLSSAGYDLTPGGKYINKDGTLTDEAWLTPEGEYVAPYLYQKQSYEHISPNDLPSNTSLDRKYRGKQEPEQFAESRGGDLGGGGYVGKTKWAEEFEDPDYLFDTYSRDSYAPTKAYISAPHEDYFINSTSHYNDLNPYVKNNYLKFIQDAGGSEQEVLNWINDHHFESHGRPLYYYATKLKDPMVINDLLTRKYGIPGFKDPETVQAVIGDEGLNTYITHSYRVPHEDRIQAAIDDDMFVKDHTLFDSDGDFMKDLDPYEEKALIDAGILTEQPIYEF